MAAQNTHSVEYQKRFCSPFFFFFCNTLSVFLLLLYTNMKIMRKKNMFIIISILIIINVIPHIQINTYITLKDIYQFFFLTFSLISFFSFVSVQFLVLIPYTDWRLPSYAKLFIFLRFFSFLFFSLLLWV